MTRTLLGAFGPTNQEVEGIEVDFVLDSTPGNELSIVLLCRRAGGSNHAYKARLEKLLRPHRGKLQASGSIPELLARSIIIQVYSEVVVKGWWTEERGVRRDTVPLSDAEELPFTPQNFVRLMKACPDLFDQLRMQVDGPENFREGHEDPEADAGNS